MDAGSTGFLGEAGNQFFNFLTCGHHQVGELVDHHHDKRQFFQRFGIIGGEAERIGDFAAVCGGFGNGLVETGQVAYAQMAHQAVAFFHFVDTPVERVRRQLHIGNDRREQVRDALVNAQFQHFRVNHNHAYVFGRRFKQHRQNHGVDAH